MKTSILRSDFSLNISKFRTFSWLLVQTRKYLCSSFLHFTERSKLFFRSCCLLIFLQISVYLLDNYHGISFTLISFCSTSVSNPFFPKKHFPDRFSFLLLPSFAELNINLQGPIKFSNWSTDLWTCMKLIITKWLGKTKISKDKRNATKFIILFSFSKRIYYRNARQFWLHLSHEEITKKK